MAKKRKKTTKIDDLFESSEQRAAWEAGEVDRFRSLLRRIKMIEAELEAAKRKNPAA